MGDNADRSGGKSIGDIVQSALSSGDLSRLKDIGPAVQKTVSELTGVEVTTRSGDVPATRGERRPAGQKRAEPPRPAWQGGGPRKKGVPRGIVRIVFGAMGMVAGGICALIFAALALIFPLRSLWVALAAAFGGVFVLGGVLLGSGLRRNRRAALIGRYYDLLEKKPVYTFEALAAEVGRTPKQIRKDIRKARAAGLMEDVRTDADETCVMLGEETYRQYLETERGRRERESEQAERQRRLEDPATSAMEQFRTEGDKTVRRIRRANDAIPGEEISGKLEKLEDTCGRIFSYVEAHPDKLPETRKFMDYYLPTTLKLVEKYRQYEEMDFQPDNVKAAKRDIEGALDTIDAAFNNFLEGLFAHDTLDVATDIEVLQQMLEQEGLTGSRFEIDMKE